MSFILGVRQIRGEMDIAPARRLDVLLQNPGPDDIQYLARNRASLMRLAGIAEPRVLAPGEPAPISAVALVGRLEILVPMAGLIDPTAELERLAKRLRRAEVDIEKLEAKLANGDFAKNAPAEVVAKDRAARRGAARGDRPARHANRPREPLARPMSAAAAASAPIAAILAQLNRVILGKEEQIRLCLACLLARGHLLIEDIPGVGKTTLAHALARTLGLSFQRVQFTSDLLPADVLGVSIFDRETGKFRFQRGPIFAQLVLADEINRASPKAQSALLEAMEERQVTLDGQSMPLPEPFFVIATQNPQEQVGTFPLPESQLDRFLMRVHLGYPAAAAERELLCGTDRRELVNSLSSISTVETLHELQQRVLEVHVAPALLDYVQALIAHTRSAAGLAVGLSPRAGIGLVARRARLGARRRAHHGDARARAGGLSVRSRASHRAAR